MAIKIIIGKGNTTNGQLELSDKGKTKADKGSNIKWEIKDSPNVKSFKIELKSDPDDIFSTRPFEDGEEWKATIKGNAPDYAECKYSIHWLDKDKNSYEHDPKIAVNPTRFSPYWLIVFFLGIIGFLSLKSRLKAKRKN